MRKQARPTPQLARLHHSSSHSHTQLLPILPILLLLLLAVRPDGARAYLLARFDFSARPRTFADDSTFYTVVDATNNSDAALWPVNETAPVLANATMRGEAGDDAWNFENTNATVRIQPSEALRRFAWAAGSRTGAAIALTLRWNVTNATAASAGTLADPHACLVQGPGGFRILAAEDQVIFRFGETPSRHAGVLTATNVSGIWNGGVAQHHPLHRLFIARCAGVPGWRADTDRPVQF